MAIKGLKYEHRDSSAQKEDTMNFDYSHLVTGRKVPDQAISPPEPTDEVYEKNVRNSCRREAIMALGTVISRLDEINHHGAGRYTQRNLQNLQEYLQREMED